MGRLANVEQLPVLTDENRLSLDPNIKAIWDQSQDQLTLRSKLLQIYAAKLLDEGKLNMAWQVLLLEIE
ncbi:hypothetical protein D3C86_2042710 [compost metagenome]